MTSYRPNDQILAIFAPLSLVGITDGFSNTILFGEISNYEPNWPPYEAVIQPYWAAL